MDNSEDLITAAVLVKPDGKCPYCGSTNIAMTGNIKNNSYKNDNCDLLKGKIKDWKKDNNLYNILICKDCGKVIKKITVGVIM